MRDGLSQGAASQVHIRPPDQARFHGAKITSDDGLRAYRELDDAVSLIDMAAAVGWSTGQEHSGTGWLGYCGNWWLVGSPATMLSTMLSASP